MLLHCDVPIVVVGLQELAPAKQWRSFFCCGSGRLKIGGLYMAL